MLKQDKRRTVLVVCGLLALAALAALMAGVYGRYMSSDRGEGTAQAKEFYFTSDYLGPAGTAYTLPAGVTEVTFQLRNWQDSLRWSEETITYEVKVNGKTEKTGTIDGGAANSVSVKVELEGDAEIQVVGSAGYVQSLYGSFELQTPSESVYMHLGTESLDYVVLTVWTYNKEGDVVVKFPDGLLPDNTDPAMKDVKASAEKGFTHTDGLDAYSSYSYRFFKVNRAASFSVNNFTVSVGGQEAVPGNLLP